MHAHMTLPRSRAVPVSAIGFMSGAAGLVFEVVWFHRAGLVLGNSVWATSIVLSSFMAGLALGSLLVNRFPTSFHRSLQAYAALETTVALSGLSLPVVGGVRALMVNWAELASFPLDGSLTEMVTGESADLPMAIFGSGTGRRIEESEQEPEPSS